MSMTTHRFHSFETLARAQDWLCRLGFPANQIEVSSTGLPTLTIQTDEAHKVAVEMIVNAAELTDPRGWPAFDESDPSLVMPDHAEAQTVDSETSPIGWHPVE